ncbi:MAG: terpene cyclase/mutase family protein [Oscillospiraceae bacterium]|nr:terpene cyclase/mutase family protein [Oscillospiraceae bacterium]
MKKLVCAILALCLTLCLFASCESGTGEADALETILKNYKKTGLSSWWEVVAIYNAGENPTKYKGFSELCLSLEGTTNLKMASYVIVAELALASGASPADFDKYDTYRENLRKLLEEPLDSYTLNDYIFAYYALKCSGTEFDEGPAAEYMQKAQKPDGGFSLSGDLGDSDMTAFAVPVLKLMGLGQSLEDAVAFLEENINENGTFSSYGSENANSTACALSAFICYGYDGEIKDRATEGLELFRGEEGTGYAFLVGGRADALATAQAAIALGDLKNTSSVWERLYEYSSKSTSQ